MRTGSADPTATTLPHRSEARAGHPKLRRDAAANRDRVLSAAAIAIRREGVKVPLATIASDAGVGVGTLYRSYPSRDALLSALTHRSFGLVLEAVERALETDEPAIAALGHFLEQTIDHGDQLILPMHGGPVLLDEHTVARRAEVHDAFERLLLRGRDDGTIRADVTAADIVVFGAFLAQPLPHTRGWKRVARRQARIYLDGLGGTTPMPEGRG
jgi:AcrR family transcriptional regulator